jgi:hypothetical protein
MGAMIITSAPNHSRIHHARVWLDARSPAKEVLILAATADAANELAREVAKKKGAAFGWHRMSLSQFAAVLAAPLLAERGIVALGDLGVQAICARVIHHLSAEAGLGRYANIADGPGFSQALGQVITELRLAKLDPASTRVVAPDLVPLFEAYESDLAAWTGQVC